MMAVVDASIWVAALKAKNPKSAARIIFDACVFGRVTPIFTEETLDELLLAMEIPKLKITRELRSKLERFIRGQAIFVSATGRTFGCRDGNDDGLLDAAVQAGATFLVSHDLDLLDPAFVNVGFQFGVRIVSAAAFLTELRNLGIVNGDEVQRGVSYLKARPLPKILQPIFASASKIMDEIATLDCSPSWNEEDAEFISQCRESLNARLETKLTIIRDISALSLEEASVRLESTQYEAARYATRKAEILARCGERALAQTGFFLSDIVPDSIQDRYRDADIVSRGVRARLGV